MGYDNLWYAGIVGNFEANIITVLFMHRSGDNFFWPVTEDRQGLPMVEIMYEI